MLLFDLGPSELILIWPVPASYSPHLSHAFNVAVTIHTMCRCQGMDAMRMRAIKRLMGHYVISRF